MGLESASRCIGQVGYTRDESIHVYVFVFILLTPLEPQSRLGTKLLEI